MARAAAFVLALLLMLCAALGAAYALCASAPVMARLFDAFSDKQAADLEKGQYAALSKVVTDYLTGVAPDMDVQATSSTGEARRAFTNFELRHMADVRSLVSLCRTLLLYCAGAAIVTLGVMLIMKRPSAKPYARGARDAALLGLGAVAALGLWAVVNFNGLLYAFHLAFFRGERTWLLDPNRHLMIQLMPAPFFTGCAAIVGGAALLACGACLAWALHALRRNEG